MGELKVIEQKLDLLIRRLEKMQGDIYDIKNPPGKRKKTIFFQANDFVDSVEALIILGLYKKGKHKATRCEYLKWLVDRGLLSRAGTNNRNMKYKKSECQELFERHINEGLSLTVKPKKERSKATASK